MVHSDTDTLIAALYSKIKMEAPSKENNKSALFTLTGVFVLDLPVRKSHILTMLKAFCCKQRRENELEEMKSSGPVPAVLLLLDNRYFQYNFTIFLEF